LATDGILLGNKTPVGTWAADGVSSAGTANITDVGGAAHGLSLAVGDLVHISNCTTASHKGFYRIVTAGATTLVLDRVLAATDTDLTVTFYKDVIGFFATDGVNGQRITGYSHQDKPLQIGGDVLAATGHSLGGEDVLIGGKLEVDGAAYFDSISGFTVINSFILLKYGYKAGFYFGDHMLGFHSNQAQTTFTEANDFPIILAAQKSLDSNYDHGAQTNPTLFIHSAVDPDTRNDEFATLSHDTMRVGADYGSYLQMKSITEEVTIAVGSGLDPVVVTSGNLAPASSLIVGATFRVTDAPGGGATTISIGRTGGGNLDEFISVKSCDVLGETGNTLAGDGDATVMPLMNSAAATLTLTTNADVTTNDMKIRVTVFYINMSAPTA